MKAFLWVFVDGTNDLVMGANGARWTAANTAQKGPLFARWLRQWAKAYIADCTCLPVNVFGTWNKSRLDDEDLAREIGLHLQEIGKWIKAMDIVYYLDRPAVK